MGTLKSVIKIKRHSFLLMKVEKQKNMKKYGLKWKVFSDQNLIIQTIMMKNIWKSHLVWMTIYL